MYTRAKVGAYRFLPPILAYHAHSQQSWLVKPMRHCPFSFGGMGCHLQQYVTQNDTWWVNRKLKEAPCHLRQTEPFTPSTETLGWLPGTWVLYKDQYCTQYLLTGWGSPWDDFVKRNVKQRPVLWVWVVWMGDVLRQKGIVSRWSI